MFYVEEFLNHLENCRYSRKTIKEYRYLLDHLKTYCEHAGVDDVTGISESLMRTYLAGRQHTGKHAYIGIKRLRKYFQFLEREGYLFLSPMQDLSIRSPPRSISPAIEVTEMERMLSEIRTDHPICLKGKAMMELAYSSALRPRELYHLKTTDIDFKKGLLFIEQSKGEKDRIVPVGEHALFWTEKYLSEVRPKYIKNNQHEFVFISHKTGEKLTVWGVRWAIRRTLEQSGFAPIKPYALRHTAATALHHNGMGVGYISKLLGHVEIRTTQIYLNVNTRELAKEIQTKHPRAAFEKRLSHITQEKRSNEV